MGVDFAEDYGKDELFGGKSLTEPIKTVEVETLNYIILFIVL